LIARNLMDKLARVNQPPGWRAPRMQSFPCGLVTALARALLLAVVSAACAGAPAARAEEPSAWAASVRRALTARGFDGAKLSALVVERASDRELVALNPDAALMPASTQKVLTAVAALSTFGPTHRFVTEVRASRPIGTDGAVGDLFVSGGDPALTSEQWWRLAADLRALGLREVRGDLVLDDGLFDEQRWHASWAPVSARAYHAPVSPLSANFGAFRVRVAPGAAPGAPVSASIDPPVPYLQLVSVATTGKARAASTLLVEREALPGAERVRVSGVLPLGAAPDDFWRSVSDPLGYAGAVMRLQLEANGVRVTGGVRRGAAAPEAALLLTFEGLPLQQIASLFLKYSNNFIAECLLKWLALGPAPLPDAPPGSWSAGAAALRERLTALGVPLGEAQLVDGSGLSRANRVSARALVEALRAGAAAFESGPELLAGLPLAGLDGTLEHRAEAARARVRAKTGSLDGVTSLAGFARSPGGREVVFAVIANGARRGDSASADAMDGVAAALARD
jgi:D-alanyl-D-alanine carboxypeptidase/D-alanyl-D-alanine-endopeptidase (penicillin-binding protein 4)